VPAAAIVFAAAPLSPTERLRARLGNLDHPFVVAADDGATTALAFGLVPDLVIGDLDSLDPATRDRLSEVTLETYPRDKDATDGQLAVERALRERPSELLLLGFLGGARLDQSVANIFLLVDITTPAVLLDERNECVLVRPGLPHEWTVETDEVVSLVPIGGDVRGVRTVGLRWRLDGDRLRLGDTRGVSNEPTASQARVSVDSGLLLVTRHFPS
jgi:thiamine pyrophosphokinase